MPSPKRELTASESYNAIADAIIDALEAATLKIAGRLAAVADDQAKAREDIYALTRRMESLEKVLASRTDHLA